MGRYCLLLRIKVLSSCYFTRSHCQLNDCFVEKSWRLQKVPVSSFGLYFSKVKYPQITQLSNLKNFDSWRNPLSSSERLKKINSNREFLGKAMIQKIQLTSHCSLLNFRSFQKRFICSGLNSECAHLEAGKPYSIVPPPLPSQLSNSSQCSSFICGGYLHWKAKPRGPLEGSCRQLRNVHRLARLSLLSYCLLPCQCNLTTCCYRQYKWSFLSGVKRRRNYVIRSFGHLSQLLNVKTGSESEEDITF